MKRVGLHLRLNGSLMHVAHKAVRLQLPFFQCFFVLITTNKMIRPSAQEIKEFVSFRAQHFGSLYLHGSYWINLSSLEHNGYHVLQKELELAKKLAFTHMVLHSGSAKGAKQKVEGIDMLARVLNTLFKTEHEINILLENTAHGNFSIESGLQDF